MCGTVSSKAIRFLAVEAVTQLFWARAADFCLKMELCVLVLLGSLCFVTVREVLRISSKRFVTSVLRSYYLSVCLSDSLLPALPILPGCEVTRE